MFNWKRNDKKKQEEAVKNVKQNEGKSSSITSAYNRDQMAYDTWKADKERRNKGFIPGSKEGASFREASRPMQYNSPLYQMRPRKENTSSKWRSEIAEGLGKSYGKKYDDRVKNALKSEHGMSDGQVEDFMKFMDAQERDAELGKGEYARLESTKIKNDTTAAFSKQWDRTIQYNKNLAEQYAEQKDKNVVPDEKEQDKDRGFLDRTFDALLVGNYVSANMAKSFLSGGEYKLGTAISDGLRAANPIGEGYEQGEGMYSDILRQLESKYGNDTTEKIRDTTVGKIGIGTLGFVLDVLLDPTTYATLGVSAAIKGAGRLGSAGSSLSKSLTKEYGISRIKGSDEIASISDDLYQKVFTKTQNEMQGHAVELIEKTARATTDNMLQGLKVGFDGMDISTAKKIVEKANSTKGLTRTASEITKDAENLTRKYNKLLGYSRDGKIGVSLGNLPFAESIVGKNLASKTLGFSDKTVRKIADKLRVSAPYTKLRNGLYSMKAVSHLSTNSVLYRMARKSPDELYKMVNYVEATRKLKGGVINSEKAIQNFVNNLSGLSPHEQKEVIELMQDKAKWKPVVEQMKLAQTVEGQAFRQALESTKVEEFNRVQDLVSMRQGIDEMRAYSENDLFDMKTQLDALEKDYAAQLSDIDLELLAGTKAYDDVTAMISNEKSKLADDFTGASSDLIKKEVELPALPSKPRLGWAGKPKTPEQLAKPDAPKLETVPSKDSFVKVTDTSERDYLFNKWVEYKEKAFGTQDKFEYIANLNKWLEGDVQIARLTYDYEIDRLVKKIEEGTNKATLNAYIKQNAWRFDGRAPEVYTIVANKFGYGGGSKYKNWDEYYTQRINNIQGSPNAPANRRLIDKLERDAVARSNLIAKLKNMSMEDILKHKKHEADTGLFNLADTRNADLNSTHNAPIGKKVAKETQEEVARIDKFNYEQGRTATAVTEGKQFEDTYTSYKLVSSEVDEAKAFVFKTASRLDGFKVLNNGGMVAFADNVVGEVSKVLEKVFKKSWSDLTDAQRSLAVSVAAKNVSEGTTQVASDLKPLIKHIEDRLITRHAQAVNNVSKIGDKVRMRESDITGVIVNKQAYPDGLVEYDIRYADGTVITHTTNDIGELAGSKPADILYSQIVRDDLDDEYAKVVAAIEERNQQRLFDHIQESQSIDKVNAQASEEYAKRLDEWNTKRHEDHAKALEDYNKKYAEIDLERRRIEALNKATAEQYEEAVRQSSALAEEYFKRGEKTASLIEEANKLAGSNNVRKISIEQLNKKLAEDKSQLLSSMKILEDDINKLDKYLMGGSDLPGMVKLIDEDIAKVQADIDTLRAQEPVDMEDLIQREDNLRRQIEQRQASIRVDRYDEKTHKRLNNALPNKPNKPDLTPTELKVIEEIKQLQEQMKQVQKEIGDARTRPLKENWNEEMSRLISTKSTLESQRKIYDGSTDIDKLVAESEERIAEIDKILSDDDLLETYIKSKVAPEQIQKWYNDMDNNKVLDELSMENGNQYSKRVTDTAKALRKAFIQMGMKEIEIGRLKQGAFDELIDNYLPHVLSPAGRKFLRSREGKKVVEQGGLPFGFYTVANPFAKARTLKEITLADGTVVKNPTIEQINQYFKEKHNVDEFFTTNLPDIYLTRAMKHSELVYADDYMENMMAMFGKQVTRDNVDKSDSYVVNVGKLREFVNGKISQQIEFAINSGIMRASQTYSDDMLEAVRHDILKSIDVNPKVIENELQPMLSLTKKQAKLLLDEGQDWIYDVPKEIAMKSNQARMIASERDHNRMLQMYDKFVHWTKLMQTVVAPSFHIRNKMGNMFNSWLSVGGRVNSVSYQKKMFDVIKNKGDYEKLKHLEPLIINLSDGTQTTMRWDEVYEAAKRYGVIDEGFFAQEFGASVAKGTQRDKPNWKPWDMNNFIAVRAGTTVGSFNENMDRLAQFSAHISDGKSLDEAKELVDKYLFDYSDLTLFEQRVMKRILPYYTFWRKNTSLQLKSIDENSQKLGITAKAMNIGEGSLEEDEKVERKYIGDYAKSWVQLPLWSKGIDAFSGKEADEPILLNPALPFMDLDRIPNPFEFKDSLLSVGAQMSVPIKTPLEFATNKNFFFDSPISAKQRVVDEDGKSIKDEDGNVQYEQGKSKMFWDYVKHMTMQTAPVSQTGQLFTKEGTDKALHALYMLSGVKSVSYNYETAKSIENNKEAYEKGYMPKWQRESYEAYQNSRKVPIDKVLEWGDKNLSIAGQHAKLSEKYYNEAGKLAGAIDRWTRGEELLEEDKKYKAFIDVMKNVGDKFGYDENATRDFIGGTLDKTSLDGIVLGKDFTTLNVTNVLDGDTFTVEYKGKKRSVRFLLVDTPETSKSFGTKDMPFSQEAFKFTRDMVEGRDVQMVIDSRGTDHYGRLLSYIYVDGKLLQGSLVEEGLASVAYSDFEGSERNNYNESTLRALQRIAKDNKKGIHSIDGYVNRDGSYNK